MPKKKASKKSEFDLVHITPAQVQEIKSEINELEKMFTADQASGRPKIQNEIEFKAEIKKKKQVLHDHAPKRLKGPKANRAYALAKELKKKIQAVMPSSNSYFQRYPKSSDNHNRQADFERTVNQQVAFMKNSEIQRAVAQYKNIMRRLNVDDPTITSIEGLRK